MRHMRRLGAVLFGGLLFVTAFLSPARSAEWHVAVNGNDADPGTREKPLRTIQRAADLAEPGDVITVHEGIYREWVKPRRGGLSDQQRIVFRAAPGERVEIRGSEIVKGWKHVEGDVWKVTLPNAFFGEFNPYSDLIRGDWFNPKGRRHHTGAVYLNGHWLVEAAGLDELLEPGAAKSAAEMPLWFAQVDEKQTTIWAQFPGVDPNKELVEINVRRAVFYPEKPGVNYITVRGFILRQAATPWAPPTAEQVGLIGTHWSKGWVIENNTISHSVCCGITLGKYGDQWDNTSQNTAEGYVQTIRRALKNGWSRQQIGHHIVRNNHISHCEQAGIVGSLGAVFSKITGNEIHHIHVRRLFSGAEMAGIKLHAAIDVVIRGNHIHHTCRGLWLDWMAQGTRVTGNLLHDNASQDLFVEVNHGPFLVDNNIFLSAGSLLDVSEGGAYVHNLMAGRIVCHPELRRSTPYHPPHSTEVAGLSKIQGGDDRFYNNLFVGPPLPADAASAPPARGFGLWVYDGCHYPLQTGGNVYFGNSRPWAKETGHTLCPTHDPQIRLEQRGSEVYLHVGAGFGRALKEANTALVTTQLLGKARVSGAAFENPDGSPLVVDSDYFGQPRDRNSPTPGPFENPGTGPLKLKVW